MRHKIPTDFVENFIKVVALPHLIAALMIFAPNPHPLQSNVGLFERFFSVFGRIWHALSRVIISTCIEVRRKS
jgi:hypothetical protein